MKKAFLSLVCPFVTFVGLLAQSPAEQELFQKLTKGPQFVEAIEKVLKSPEEYSALILYVGSSRALEQKRLEDSAFLFYAAQMRARFDRACFPPKGEGGDSPFLVYAALSQQIGSAVNPAVMAEPKVFEKAFERVKKWTPRASKEYHPGYEFIARKSEAEALESTKLQRKDYVDIMDNLSKLLNDAEYFAAFKTIQASNLGPDENRPTKAAVERATETMKRIEKDKGLRGIFSLK